MNGWEGQVLAIAVKELLEAARTLGRDGFGFKKDKTLLSAVIRDLLSQTPNIPRARATLQQVESLGPRPPADYYIAKDLLAKVQQAFPPLPAGEGRGEGRLNSRRARSQPILTCPERASPRHRAGHPQNLMCHPEHREGTALSLNRRNSPHARVHGPRDNS